MGTVKEALLLPKYKTVNLPGGATLDLVWVEPGIFVMGSPPSEQGHYADERPHEVTIRKGFYLGKHVVTQGQWEAVMGTAPWFGRAFVRENSNNPAVFVSWEDVQKFIQKLNGAAGEVIWRLPTEAEWEYACRAGTTTPWSFGGDEGELGNHAWYHETTWYVEEEYAHAVGAKRANPWGLYDMHGNVWEWCQDWVSEVYPRIRKIDPPGPNHGSARIARGGSFRDVARSTRSASRGGNSPHFRDGFVGARLLRIK